MAEKDLHAALESGLDGLSVTVSRHQQQQLLDYLALLHKWNKAYNLTAIRDLPDMLALHLLDSLSVAPLICGERFIDVGTGPGLPGIPLAILFPERQFVLLDSNGKKTRFLFQAINSLGLSNVQEVQSRVEQYQPDRLFDGILSRAFASIVDMVLQSGHLLAENGRFYAMKGQLPQQELSALPKGFKVTASHKLDVPQVDAERYLIEIIPSATV